MMYSEFLMYAVNTCITSRVPTCVCSTSFRPFRAKLSFFKSTFLVGVIRLICRPLNPQKVAKHN